MTPVPSQTPRLIRLSEVMHLTGLARSTIYEKIKQPRGSGGCFPTPLKLGAISVWVEAEVHAWIADQIKRRNEEAAAPGGATAHKSASISAKSNPHSRTPMQEHHSDRVT